MFAGVVGARKSISHDCFPDFSGKSSLVFNFIILFVLYSDCNCQHEPFEHLAKIDRLLLRKYLLFKVFMLNVFF